MFHAPLPATVIAELLGIPEEHHLDVRRWSAHALRVASPEHRPALAGLQGLLADLVADKRRRPQDDLLSALVAVRDEEDGRLTEEELVGTAMMLIVAGHESTVNLLGDAVLALLQHPEQRGSAPASSAACCPFRCAIASADDRHLASVPGRTTPHEKRPGPRREARAGTEQKGYGCQGVRVRSWRAFHPSRPAWTMKNTPPPVA
ncbi:cytochrome P450 family protein [Streptomyces mirabilis]|uniref:hypothetical protein n=1 Tax=Streptomyces mirabilis TaxID=68239 RepID=UPI0036D88097